MANNQKGAELLMSLNRKSPPETEPPPAPLRKFTQQVPAGQSEYTICHPLGTRDVLVQTRIAGRIREGGISILDENRIQLTFGGTLNEPIDVIVIG